MTELVRSIDFRDDSADMLRFLVTGEAGAVQFLVRTHWPYVAKVEQADPYHWRANDHRKHLSCHPMAVDVGIHSRAELEYASSVDDCYVLGGPCWYDGSGLAAERLFARFAEQGTGAVWAELEDWYRAKFLAPAEVPA